MLDLSRPLGSGVNDFINKDDYSLQYCNVDDAIRHLLSYGVGANMAKLDIKHAFRLIPVRPADWPLLSYKLNNSYFFDIVPPFGCRSSPFLFCCISNAILWIINIITEHYAVVCYVDDYLSLPHPHQISAFILSIVWFYVWIIEGFHCLWKDRTPGHTSHFSWHHAWFNFPDYQLAAGKVQGDQ